MGNTASNIHKYKLIAVQIFEHFFDKIIVLQNNSTNFARLFDDFSQSFNGFRLFGKIKMQKLIFENALEAVTNYKLRDNSYGFKT